MTDDQDQDQDLDDLALTPGGNVVRVRDQKTIARIRDRDGKEEIVYEHYKLKRYAPQIIALMEAGPTNPAYEPEPEAELEPAPMPDGAWKPGDPAPRQDPSLGDLTPEWIEWARANLAPEEFRRRYRNGLRLVHYEAGRQ